MIKLENTEVLGWEHAIRGMRNPMNSWDKSDSYENYNVEYTEDVEIHYPYYRVGATDLSLMKKLSKAGTDHRKFMRIITVYVDITAPLYWWKEFDTYKVGTVANSCSTMHKIQEKEFTLDDFSHEHLNNISTIDLEATIGRLNDCRETFLASKDKDWWWQMIQLLPSSYNQKRTVMLNYEVLANIYKSRKSHKLDEWSIDGSGESLCKWIETLPHSELITGKEN